MDDIFVVRDEETYDQAATFAIDNVSTDRGGIRRTYGYISDQEFLYNDGRDGLVTVDYDEFAWECANCEHQCDEDEPLYLCIRVLGPDLRRNKGRQSNDSFELVCYNCAEHRPPPTRTDQYDLDMGDLVPVTYHEMESDEPLECYVNDFFSSLNIKG